MVNEISVGVIAISFSCLVVYGIKTLKKTMVSLDETNKTLIEVRTVTNKIADQAEQLLHTATDVTADVKAKIKSIQPLIETAHDVGDILHQVTDPVKQAVALGAHHSVKNLTSTNKVRVRVGQNESLLTGRSSPSSPAELK